MRNLNACSVAWRVLATLFALFFALVAPASAWADDKQDCSNAYDQTQSLRHVGRLQEARRAAAVCTRDVCKDFIRTDCTKWLGEIDLAQPTVVFGVKDVAGRDAVSVKISLDGKPWLDHLDGQAKPIDPGNHTVRYMMDGAPPIDDTILIREGDRGRALTASFQTRSASAAPGPGPPSDSGHAHSVGPWIVGGVGVAVLVAGAVTGGLVLADKSSFNEHCSSVTKTCDTTGISAASQGRVLGPATTAELVVGGAALGAGAIWLVADLSGGRKRQSSASFIVAPIVSSHVGALVVQGGW